MNLLAIAPYLPSRFFPHYGTFVRDQYEHLARHFPGMSVVAPMKWASRKGWLWNDRPLAFSGLNIRLRTPRYPTCGTFTLFGLCPTIYFFRRSILRAVRREGLVFQATYAHFLDPAGICAVDLARLWPGAKSFIAMGEAELEAYDMRFGRNRVSRYLNAASGLVCVSHKNRRICQEHYGVPGERILLAPNGVDPELFRPRSQAGARRRLGLPMEKRIAIFVGYLIERKGVSIVTAAVSSIPGMGLVLLGDGPVPPGTENLLHAGVVDHCEVPWWLSAADVFVFPSTAEGCPNAVLEAAACGLPIVASDIPEIRELGLDGRVVLAKPGDPAAFAAGIRAVLPEANTGPRGDLVVQGPPKPWSIEARMGRIAEWIKSFAS